MQMALWDVSGGTVLKLLAVLVSQRSHMGPEATKWGALGWELGWQVSQLSEENHMLKVQYSGLQAELQPASEQVMRGVSSLADNKPSNYKFETGRGGGTGEGEGC